MAINTTQYYVKFIKGTTKAFTNLVDKDPHTLYFISDDDTSGKLYLGSKLISGGGEGGSDSPSSGVVSLADLEDVVLSTLGNKQLLVYNAVKGKWENSSISTLISAMTGATKDVAGTAGLVPQPQAGDQNKFLRGDGTWVTLDIDENLTNGILDNVEKKLIDLRTDVEDLVEQVEGLDATVLGNRITALEKTINGVEGTPGLTAVVNGLSSDIDAIKAAIETDELDDDGKPMTIITKVTNLSDSLDSLKSRMNRVEASVKWGELTED